MRQESFNRLVFIPISELSEAKNEKSKGQQAAAALPKARELKGGSPPNIEACFLHCLRVAFQFVAPKGPMAAVAGAKPALLLSNTQLITEGS